MKSVTSTWSGPPPTWKVTLLVKCQVDFVPAYRVDQVVDPGKWIFIYTAGSVETPVFRCDPN